VNIAVDDGANPLTASRIPSVLPRHVPHPLHLRVVDVRMIVGHPTDEVRPAIEKSFHFPPLIREIKPAELAVARFPSYRARALSRQPDSRRLVRRQIRRRGVRLAHAAG
jgi:hypothetical protein